MTPIEILITIGLCIAPVSELRGGLPYALLSGMPPASAFALAVAANVAIVPLLLGGLAWGEGVLRRWAWSERIVEGVLSRTRRKGRLVERLGSIGLILLVAVPLPGTGAWTGALAASMLGIPARRAFPLIAVGVVIAGVLVLLASLGIIELVGGFSRPGVG